MSKWDFIKKSPAKLVDEKFLRRNVQSEEGFWLN
jgi:hypothetical protein